VTLTSTDDFTMPATLKIKARQAVEELQDPHDYDDRVAPSDCDGVRRRAGLSAPLTVTP
jgi:hypothetical protein